MNSPVKLWRNQKKVASILGKEGKVTAWTIIRVPPEGFSAQAPYPVMVVALDDHSMITAQMVDWEPGQCRIGQRVRVVLRKITEPSNEGVIPYGIKVKPIV